MTCNHHYDANCYCSSIPDDQPVTLNAVVEAIEQEEQSEISLSEVLARRAQVRRAVQNRVRSDARIPD